MEDAEDMYEYASNAETCRFLKWGPYQDLDDAKNFLADKIKNYEEPNDILFGIQLKEDAKLIGVIRVYNIAAISADVSYIQNNRFCGKGYMTEALSAMICLCFKKLNLLKVQAYYAEGNTRSEKVMIRSGMKKVNDYQEHQIIKGNRVWINKYIIERGI